MKRNAGLIFTFLLLLLISELLSGQNHVADWKAGVARIKITPEQDMWLAGYASRTKPSEGKIHDLWAKGLYLEDAAGNAGLLITTDLLCFSKEVSDQIRERLQEEMGLAKSQIILNSSHTHSGPVLVEALTNIYPIDASQEEKISEYSGWLVDQIIHLAREARSSMQAAKIFTGNGVVRFQVNRRNNKESQMEDLTELKGPNDYAVPVLKVENREGKTEAIVFGYACHPTVLSGYKWSGDYPGFAQLELEQEYKGATALFFQGAGADMNPLPRRSVALAKQYGQELAAAVERVLSEKMESQKPVLFTDYSEINLEMHRLPVKEKLVELVNELDGYNKTWAEKMLKRVEQGIPVNTFYPYPVQFWQVGDQGIVSLGGELLVEYSIQLKRLLGKETFVMGYSNDVMAYIPGEEVLQEGGYEGKESFREYDLPSYWKPGIEKAIINEVVNMAKRSGKKVNVTASEVLREMPGGLLGTPGKKGLTATHYYSGFELAHDTYNAISTASDGRVYYCLSSQSIDVGGQYYVYDPKSDRTKHLGDITEICGEAGTKSIPQGKSHSNFYESKGKLYTSTHAGYYEMIDGMEMMVQNPPEGYNLYPGGHILSYDLASGEFEDLVTLPRGEAVVTMTMDTLRRQIYIISWPKGYFFHYDVEKDELKDLGKISGNGEAGVPGKDYRVLCRSLVVDPRDGTVYFSTSEGDILSYHPDWDAMKKLEGVNLRLDYFGKYDPTRPGSMQYNWRRIIWYPGDNVAYGVHGNSGYLFRFDPKAPTIEIVERITSEPSKKSGMFDYFSYGYLGFDLGPDRETLYYLTGGPIYIDGKRVEGVEEIAMGAARGLENLHLVTYHIPTGKYTDHGPIFYADGSRPTYVNSIAVGKDGTVYTLARFEYQGREIEDLVKIPDPF